MINVTPSPNKASFQSLECTFFIVNKGSKIKDAGISERVISIKETEREYSLDNNPALHELCHKDSVLLVLSYLNGAA